MPIVSPNATPVKIAFCITDLDPGGAERAMVQLIIRLDRERWEPRVYCLSRPGKLVEDLEFAGIPVVCFNAKRWWQIGSVWRLFRCLREFRPRLIQSFLFHANLASRVAGWMAGVRHRISGIRVAERRRQIYLWLDRWTEWMVERQICVSQSVADFSIQIGRLTRGKILVIPNGVDVTRFAGIAPLDLGFLGMTPEADVWVTVGRLDPQKGPWILFNAVRRLHVNHPTLRLLWAGEGPLRKELQLWIDEHGLNNIIYLLGWRDDIPKLLQAASGFVLASQWEGMPNVILEALAAGLPTISTRVEGVEEIIQQGVTGWLTPVGDSENLATIWSEVLENSILRRQVAIEGQNHVRKNFSWDTMACQYTALYEQLLEQETPPL